MNCLIGDCDPFQLYLELCKTELRYKDILKEEHRLTNLSLHALKSGADLIRVPTVFCTKGHLENSNDYDRMEPIINVCISAAKNAMKQINANVILAGCIGAVYDADHKTETEIYKELSETIVYISDFGVDVMIVQGIDDWELFELTIALCRKLTGNPIAPFFRASNINIALLNQYNELCDELDIELMGFEVQTDHLDILRRTNIKSKSPLGILLNHKKTTYPHPCLDDCANAIKNIQPTVLLGGDGIVRNTWRTLTTMLR